MKNQRISKAPKKESKIGILMLKSGCRLTKKINTGAQDSTDEPYNKPRNNTNHLISLN